MNKQLTFGFHLTDRGLTLISTVSSLSLSHEWIHDDQSDQMKRDKQLRSGGTCADKMKLSAYFTQQHANQKYQ